MNVPGCVVIERSDEWLIVVGDEVERLAPDVQPAEIAVCANLMSKLADLNHPRCILAPDSSSCFFQSLTLTPDDDIDVRDRAALAYELEDHLPIDAESMVADFVIVPSAPGEKTVSAIALPIDRWRRIIEALESSGILVTSIVPRAVLATHALCEMIQHAETLEIFLVDGDQCDSIVLKQRKIIAWKHFALDQTQIGRHKLLDSVVTDDVVVAGATASQQSLISSTYPDARFFAEDVDELTVNGAAMLLGKPSAQGFDFRRDALAPSDPLRAIQPQIRLAAFAAAACLIALAVGGWWRANRIEKEIANVTAQQQQRFREAFPDSRVPAALLRRVRSEHTKVLGSRGETTEVDIPQSAPEVLRELLAALPRNVRFRVTSIKVVDGRVDLDLQVRSPVDAGTLATSLSSAGFDVKPPGTTQKDAKTFESLLEAQWIGRPEPDTAAQDDVSISITMDKDRNG